MGIHQAPRNAPWAGVQIGILVLDERIPRVPGSVGNADTFDYPVRYAAVPGATVERLLTRMDRSMKTLFVAAAQTLQAEGAQAIVGSCGFMALFQRDVAAAVSVPTMLSSLAQLPFIEAALPPQRPIGVVTAHAGSLTRTLLETAGIRCDFDRLRICGLENCPEARGALLEEKGTLDEAVLREEVVGTAARLVRENPDVGAILLECSELPPYARDVRRATGLPVFDFTTMIDYLYAAVRRKPNPIRGF